MELMTAQCPQCATAFRLTEQQLQAAKGFVRCGQCMHVFKANSAEPEEKPENPAAQEQSEESSASAPQEVTATSEETGLDSPLDLSDEELDLDNESLSLDKETSDDPASDDLSFSFDDDFTTSSEPEPSLNLDDDTLDLTAAPLDEPTPTAAIETADSDSASSDLEFNFDDDLGALSEPDQSLDLSDDELDLETEQLIESSATASIDQSHDDSAASDFEFNFDSDLGSLSEPEQSLDLSDDNLDLEAEPLAESAETASSDQRSDESASSDFEFNFDDDLSSSNEPDQSLDLENGTLDQEAELTAEPHEPESHAEDETDPAFSFDESLFSAPNQLDSDESLDLDDDLSLMDDEPIAADDESESANTDTASPDNTQETSFSFDDDLFAELDAAESTDLEGDLGTDDAPQTKVHDGGFEFDAEMFASLGSGAAESEELSQQLSEAESDPTADDRATLQFDQTFLAALDQQQSGEQNAQESDESPDELNNDPLSDRAEQLLASTWGQSRASDDDHIEIDDQLIDSLSNLHEESIADDSQSNDRVASEADEPTPQPAEVQVDEDSWADQLLAEESQPRQDEPSITPLDEPIFAEREQEFAATETSQTRDHRSAIPTMPVEMIQKVNSRWKTALWSLLALAGAVGITAQLINANFESLSRDNEWRPRMASLCEITGCTLPSLSRPAAIKSDHLVVRSHEKYSNALVVDAVINNRAAHPQPFPVLKLIFSNMQGEVTGSGLFTPEQYLAGELAGAKMMPSRQPIRISLELLDPGNNSTNYRLEFLPAAEG